jgi:hypothetical protein
MKSAVTLLWVLFAIQGANAAETQTSEVKKPTDEFTEISLGITQTYLLGFNLVVCSY